MSKSGWKGSSVIQYRKRAEAQTQLQVGGRVGVDVDHEKYMSFSVFEWSGLKPVRNWSRFVAAWPPENCDTSSDNLNAVLGSYYKMYVISH